MHERFGKAYRVVDEREVTEIVRQVVERTLGLKSSSAPSSSSPKSPPKKGATVTIERSLVTERDVMDVARGGEVRVPQGAILTPLAREQAMARQVRIVFAGMGENGRVAPDGAPAPKTAPVVAAAPDRTVAIGSDHGGFDLKGQLVTYLGELGYKAHDCGTSSSESVDYPDYAYAVAKLVADGRAAWGIIVDGVGIGSCMAANKVPGVRAAMCYDISTARNSREHNNANVLTLGGQMIGLNLARQIVETWLDTPFAGGRHKRRVDKIMDIEKRFLKAG